MKRVLLIGDLVKYRLSLAVTLSAITGYSIGRSHSGLPLLFMSVGVFLLASGAAALNQYTEWKEDSVMGRTKTRPIPSLLISRKTALIFALLFFAAGLILLAFTGIMPVLTGIVTIILYNFVYTRLKKVTFLALLPGALVGALPPLIGFFATGNVRTGPEIVLFSSFMFLWQLPHFWLILIKYRSEYQAAGFAAAPAGMTTLQVRNLIFTWVLVSTLLLSFFAAGGMILSRPLIIFAIPVNILFIFLFYLFLFRTDGQKSVNGAFILINSFSLLVMILFIVNSLLF